MTILIHFHQSHYRDFKAYYRQHVQVHLTAEFPGLVSYSRFVSLLPRVAWLLLLYAVRRQGQCSGSGVSFIDSTALRVCHNRRIQRHKVFAGIAKRQAPSVDRPRQAGSSVSNSTWLSATQATCWPLP